MHVRNKTAVMQCSSLHQIFRSTMQFTRWIVYTSEDKCKDEGDPHLKISLRIIPWVYTCVDQQSGQELLIKVPPFINKKFHSGKHMHIFYNIFSSTTHALSFSRFLTLVLTIPLALFNSSDLSPLSGEVVFSASPFYCIWGALAFRSVDLFRHSFTELRI